MDARDDPNCPTCDIALAPAEALMRAIWACRRCRGVWLCKRRCAAAVRSAPRAFFTPLVFGTPPVAARGAGSPYRSTVGVPEPEPEAGKRNRRCPACRAELPRTAIRFEGQRREQADPLILDVCAEDGTFVRAREMARLASFRSLDLRVARPVSTAAAVGSHARGLRAQIGAVLVVLDRIGEPRAFVFHEPT